MTTKLPSNYNRNKPFISHILEKKLLTQPGSTKQTYHISLETKGVDLGFRPGDSIGIFPENDPYLIKEFLEALHLSGQEILINPRNGETLSIHEFFSKKANLLRINSSLLKLLQQYSTNHDKKNELSHLLQIDNKERLTQYINLHDPLDAIKKYAEKDLPLQELCKEFSPLLPRFYSVASSIKLFPNEVHLTVALSKYSHNGQERFGVASHFLCHLAKERETPIPIYVLKAHNFALPEDPSTPIIMVGPGTGIAPFRAFLQEREALNAPGKNWLFFGERNKQYDYFYKDYFEKLVEKKKLRLDLAFSRDQKEKIYVQRKMKEHAKDLFAFLQDGAVFYVCGDAHKMAKDVDATLLRIIQEQGNFSEEEAKTYVKNLKTAKRYQADIY